jgi:hypothetical protein
MISVLDIGSADLGETIMPWATMPNVEVTGFDFPTVLGDGKIHHFHKTRWPGCSSLLKPNSHVVDRFVGMGSLHPDDNFHVSSTIPVKTTKLDDLKFPDPDWIKMDVQGAELMILQHGQKTLAKAGVLHIEVAFLPLYEKQPLFHQVAGFLYERGWFLHAFWNLETRCFRPMNVENGGQQMTDGDAIFINPNAWTTKTAEIMEKGYGSYYLAFMILSQLDQEAAAAMRERLMAA